MYNQTDHLIFRGVHLKKTIKIVYCVQWGLFSMFLFTPIFTQRKRYIIVMIVCLHLYYAYHNALLFYYKWSSLLNVELILFQTYEFILGHSQCQNYISDLEIQIDIQKLFKLYI